MTIFARIFRHGSLRISRKVLVMVVLVSYLFAGAVHGLCELDVTNPSGATVISLAEKGGDHSGKGIVAGHHCHGCFSVSMPFPIAMSAVDEIVGRPLLPHDVERRSLLRGIEPPPPKSLT